MDNKEMVTAKGRNDEQNVFKSSFPDGVLSEKPLVILTDGLSASASEVGPSPSPFPYSNHCPCPWGCRPLFTIRVVYHHINSGVRMGMTARYWFIRTRSTYHHIQNVILIDAH